MIDRDLLLTIQSGQNDKLKEILSDDPSIAKDKTEQGISLLTYSLYCRNQEAVDIIRQYSGDLDLFEAAALGELESVIWHIFEMKDNINPTCRNFPQFQLFLHFFNFFIVVNH